MWSLGSYVLYPDGLSSFVGCIPLSKMRNELVVQELAEVDAVPRPETVTVVKTKCDCCGAFLETTRPVDTLIGKKFMCDSCHARAVLLQ